MSMVKGIPEDIVKTFKKIKIAQNLMKNKNLVDIIKIIYKENLSISQLNEKINLTYKSTYLNVRKLESMGLVIMNKDHKSSGRKVFVEPNKERIKEIMDTISYLDHLNQFEDL